MSKHEPAVQGPSWHDIHDYVSKLEGTFAVQVVFETRFWEAGRPPRRSAQVVAQARKGAAAGAPVLQMGYYAFRGNNGAATMPAAMWFALVELEARLEDAKKVAEQQAMF